MSIHLAGGGWSTVLFDDFLADCHARAAGAGRVVPRVGVILLDPGPGAPDFAGRYRETMQQSMACEPAITLVAEGASVTSAALNDIDGLVVGGGLTPAYLDALLPVVDEVRLLVGDGLPYLGISAGAMIAADAAIIGGWLIGEVPVGAEEIGEDLEEVTVVAGLGLVDLAVDVHAAQWGTLARLIAATEAGLVDGGVAIDENTVLVVGDDGLRVAGSGSVWRVTPHDDGVLVSTLGA